MKRFAHLPLSIPITIIICLTVIILCKTAQGQIGGSKTKIQIYPVVVSARSGYDFHREIVFSSALKAINESENFSSSRGEKTFRSKTDSSMKIINDAEELYKEALKKYGDLDLEGAIEKANKAIEKLELGVANIDDMTLFVQTLHLIGSCHTLNGDLNSASEAFLRAFTLAPGIKPDPGLFPPDVIEVFEAVSMDASQVATGSITVNSVPDGASVYLDGTFMGLTPITINNVVVGKHLVKIAKQGYQYFGSVLNVQQGKIKNLEAKLSEATGASVLMNEIQKIPPLFAKGINAVFPLLQSISRELGVDELLLAIISPGEGNIVSLSFYIYDSLKNAFLAQREADCSSGGEVLFPKANELAKATLVASLAKASGETTTVTAISIPTTIGAGAIPSKEETRKKKKKSVINKWWFWVAIIGGAAIAGGAGGLGYAWSAGKLGGEKETSTGDIILEFY